MKGSPYGIFIEREWPLKIKIDRKLSENFLKYKLKSHGDEKYHLAAFSLEIIKILNLRYKPDSPGISPEK